MNHPTRRQLLQAATLAAPTTLFGLPTAALAQAARGGTLVIGTTQKPRHLNSAVQSGIATMMPAAQLFASPLRMSADWKPQPYLAESFDLAQDNRSIRLVMRRDAVFHDGRPVTSEDVKFSIEQVRTHHPFKSMFEPVSSVQIDDQRTVTVRLSEPHPALLLAMSTSLSPIIPKHVFDDGTDLKIHPRNNNPVGSGAFKLIEFKPGEFIVMERFDRFFLKDVPNINRLIVREYKDATSLLLAFERGEVDIHSSLLEARDLERARKVSNVTIVPNSGPAIGPLIWLAFNTKHPKLTDKRVRQAINFAIDKKFLVDQLLGGIHGRSTGPIANGSPFYSSDVERYDLDLAKSEQLLDAAGLKKGTDGKRFTLEIDGLPGGSDVRITHEYLKPALAKVGIDVVLRMSPDFPSWARRISSLQFEATVDSVWNWGDPVIGVHRTYQSSNIRQGVIWSNTQSYSNTRVDQLMTSAGREMDLAKRKALYKEMQQIIVDECPQAFLYEWSTHLGIRQNVQDPPRGIWGMIDALNDVKMRA